LLFARAGRMGLWTVSEENLNGCRYTLQ
jgi:hypothetical protein